VTGTSARRAAAAAGVFVLAAATVVAADGPPLPAAAEGDWVATAIEFAGRRPPADLVRRYKVVVKKGAVVLDPLFISDGKFSLMGEPLEARTEAPPKAAPGEIDLVLKDEAGEHRMRGIFALDGPRLKLCWQLDGKARPAEFKTRAEPAQMLLVLERAKR
jgi:uncharacterized protein (TIGR03067 family)